MREADRKECQAFGRSPKDALRLSLRTSLNAFTAITDKPVCMFGVTPLDMVQGKGSPWLLGTNEIFNHATDLMRHGPKIIRWWQETFSTLENLVSVENEKAIALLKYWGAEMGEKSLIGQTEFVRFRFVAIQGTDAPA